MSKQVILVRHGNAKSGTYDIPDFDRTLDSVGISEAQEMAFRLKNRNLIPEMLVSSPAIRAISTARIFAGIWSKEPEDILIKEVMYESSTSSLLNIVNGLADDINSIALFGHNPEISAFAGYLTLDDTYSMPTCAVVVINFDVEQWSMLGKGLGTMLLFDYPGASGAQ
jgi:phosphohistidine phosphatase